MRTRICRQPWNCVNVLADGKVYACCVVNADMEIGDLNTHSLPEIIQGERAIRLKTRLLTGDIRNFACQGCPNAPMGSTEDLERSLEAMFGMSAPAPSEPAPAPQVVEAAETV